MTISSNARLTRALLFSTASALAAVALGACGGGSTPSSVVVAPPPAPPSTGSTFTVTGPATKTSLLGASVDVRGLDGVVLATGQTSATDGSFSLTVPESAAFDGGVVMVRVAGDADATLLCGAGAGCGDVAFGDALPVGADVALSALAAAPGDGGTVDVTPNLLTTLAAQATLQAGTDTDAVAIAGASQKVGDVFGLMDAESGTLAPGATGSDAVASARLDLVLNGALGAFHANGLDVGTGISALSADYVARGRELLVRETGATSTITVEEILNGAVETEEAMQAPSDAHQAAAARALIDIQTARIAEEGSTTLSAPSVNAGDAPIDQAKGFVNDLQKVIGAVEADSNSENFNAFVNRADASARLMENDVKYTLGLVALIAQRMRLEYESNGPDVANETISFSDGLVFAATYQGNEATYSVEQSYRGFDVDLTVVLDYTVDARQGRAEGGRLAVTGSVENPAVAMDMRDGSEITVGNGVAVTVRSDDTSSNGVRTFAVTNDVNASKIAADLDVLITQKTSGGIVLDGQLDGNISGIELSQSGRFVDGFYNAGLSEGNASLSSAEIAIAGRGEFEGKTFEISLGLFTGGDDLTFRVGNVRDVSYTRYVEEGDAIIMQDANRDDFRHTLIPDADARALIADARETGTVREAGDGTYIEQANGTRLYFTDIAAGEDVLRIEVIRDTTDEPAFSILTQRSGIRAVFSNANPDAVPASASVADYLNDVAGLRGGAFFNCIDSPADRPELRSLLYLDTDTTVVAGGDIPGVVIGEFPERPCGEVETYYQNATFRPRATASLNAGSTLQASIAASVSQDVVGLDAVDPRVTVSAYGLVEVADGEVAGEVTFELAYAGRRIQTNARSFDVFRDLSVPVVVSNRNGIVLSLSQDSDGRVEGSLVKGEETLGMIRDTGRIIYVDFVDGTFVSLR